MRDRDLAKDEAIFSIEREMLKFAHRAAQHDLLDILPLPTLNVKKYSGPDSVLPVSYRGGDHLASEKAKCTCPIKITSKKDKKKNKQRFFIGGTNNNGYEINCPKHGRRTSN